MYADRSATNATSKAAQGKQVAVSITRTDSVNISPESAMRLSNKLLETEVGKQLDAAFDKVGIDLKAGAGLDFSPEATSARIADFATGMFGIFRDQNPNLSEGELIDRFESTIRGAVDDGYAQAMKILGTMDLPDGAGDLGKQTIDLVHKRFDDFFADLRKNLPQAEAPKE
jgi:hypothetical protein